VYRHISTITKFLGNPNCRFSIVTVRNNRRIGRTGPPVSLFFRTTLVLVVIVAVVVVDSNIVLGNRHRSSTTSSHHGRCRASVMLETALVKDSKASKKTRSSPSSSSRYVCGCRSLISRMTDVVVGGGGLAATFVAVADGCDSSSTEEDLLAKHPIMTTIHQWPMEIHSGVW
jgi:hypothetical protein